MFYLKTFKELKINLTLNLLFANRSSINGQYINMWVFVCTDGSVIIHIMHMWIKCWYVFFCCCFCFVLSNAHRYKKAIKAMNLLTTGTVNSNQQEPLQGVLWLIEGSHQTAFVITFGDLVKCCSPTKRLWLDGLNIGNVIKTNN